MFEIYLKYVSFKYDWYIPEICLRCGWYMSEICMRCALDLVDILFKIWIKCQWVTEWVCDVMKARDAYASKNEKWSSHHETNPVWYMPTD